MNFEADIGTWDRGVVVKFTLSDATDNGAILQAAETAWVFSWDDNESYVAQIRVVYPSGKKRLIYDYINGFYYKEVPNEQQA